MHITSRQLLRLPHQRCPRSQRARPHRLPHDRLHPMLRRWRCPRAAATCASALPLPYLTTRPAGRPTQQSHSTARSSEQPAVVCHRARSRCAPALLPTWLPLSLRSRISQLFLHDACSALSSKSWSVQLTGCPFKASGNNSSCEAAVSHGRPSIWDGSTSWWSTVQPNAPGGSG